MIIGVLGVAGDKAGGTRIRRIGVIRRMNGLVVADGQGDEASGAGQHLLGVYTFVGVALEVGHFSLKPLREPFLEMACGEWRVGGGESAIVEPQFAGPLADDVFHRWAAW